MIYFWLSNRGNDIFLAVKIGNLASENRLKAGSVEMIFEFESRSQPDTISIYFPSMNEFCTWMSVMLLYSSIFMHVFLKNIKVHPLQFSTSW